jgi:hypothetical protein
MISARVVPSFTISISLELSTAFLLGIWCAPFSLGLVSTYLETDAEYQKTYAKIKENYFIKRTPRKMIANFNLLIYVDSPSHAERPKKHYRTAGQRPNDPAR